MYSASIPHVLFCYCFFFFVHCPLSLVHSFHYVDGMVFFIFLAHSFARAGWRGGRSMHFIMGRTFDNWIEGCHIIYGSCPLYYWQDSQFCIRPETEVMQSGLRQWVEGWLTAAKFSDNLTLDKSCSSTKCFFFRSRTGSLKFLLSQIFQEFHFW